MSPVTIMAATRWALSFMTGEAYTRVVSGVEQEARASSAARNATRMAQPNLENCAIRC